MRTIEQLKVGTIIRSRSNISPRTPEKPKWKYTYYELVDDWFGIEIRGEGLIGKFKGLHFRCLGSEYFHHLKGCVAGLEYINDENVEIVETYPNDLI